MENIFLITLFVKNFDARLLRAVVKNLWTIVKNQGTEHENSNDASSLSIAS